MSIFAEQPGRPGDPPGAALLAGRYRLLQRIGAGGMGVVWSAHDEVLRRHVAVKELRHSWGSTDRTVAQGRERSLREARAAAALDHPNIVAVYDIVDHDERPWIVMEFVAGRSLKEMVAGEGPLPVDRAIPVGLQLLSALQVAHAAGITHRDVKPANVLISGDDVVRLTDFGIATMQDAETLTETGAVLGTPGYFAPEQAKGLTPGPPADVFGLGATLYFAIEGVGPFQRDGYLPMLVAYARHEIRPPQRAGDLGPVLLRLLAADPARRPTAEQAREMLLSGAPARVRGLSRRAVIGAGALTVAAAGGTALWRGTRGSRATATPRSSASATPRPSPAPGLGAPAWHRDDLRQPIAMGSVAVGTDGDAVRAVDLETGKQRWRRKEPEITDLLTFADNQVLVEAGDTFRVLDAATGAVLAARPAGRQGILTGLGGLFLTLEGSSTLSGYDARTSRRRWRLRWAGAFGYQYCMSRGGLLHGQAGKTERDPCWLYGIEPVTGRVAWKTAVAPKGVMDGPWCTGDRLSVTVAAGDAWKLFTVDARTGTVTSAVPVATYIPGQDSPTEISVVTSAGAMTVVGVYDARLTAGESGVAAAEGTTLRWRRRLLNPVVATSQGGRIFAASYDSILHELDPATGKSLWSTPTPGPVETLTVGATMVVTSIGFTSTGYPLRR
ncbi:serine/threonine-protein kinase [Actinoplanes sp. NPDC051475]|uniref:serine/threonine-protein kinase n=1 Tax=Actinoplanes sp. NPDC051475 TaxID=3157225 RepID=UPI00344B39E8